MPRSRYFTDDYWDDAYAQIIDQPLGLDRLKTWCRHLWYGDMQGITAWLETFGILPVPKVDVEDGRHVITPTGTTNPFVFLDTILTYEEALVEREMRAYDRLSNLHQLELIARLHRIRNYLGKYLDQTITIEDILLTEALIKRMQAEA